MMNPLFFVYFLLCRGARFAPMELYLPSAAIFLRNSEKVSQKILDSI
ncbi:MAG: hypothetical protein AB4041_09655 [Microcystaceae cyanobacterium]